MLPTPERGFFVSAQGAQQASADDLQGLPGQEEGYSLLRGLASVVEPAITPVGQLSKGCLSSCRLSGLTGLTHWQEEVQPALQGQPVVEALVGGVPCPPDTQPVTTLEATRPASDPAPVLQESDLPSEPLPPEVAAPLSEPASEAEEGQRRKMSMGPVTEKEGSMAGAVTEGRRESQPRTVKAAALRPSLRSSTISQKVSPPDSLRLQRCMPIQHEGG